MQTKFKRLFNKKALLFIFFLSCLNSFVFGKQGFKQYKSPSFGYTIDYPESFSLKEKIGTNIDLKLGDEFGNSILVIVKRLTREEQNVSIDDLLEISAGFWEQNLQLPNVKVLKKGVVYVDGEKGMFLHYTQKPYSGRITYHAINYLFIHEGRQYNLTATCDIDDLALIQPFFFRSLNSFKF